MKQQKATHIDKYDQQGQGQHDQEAGRGARPAEDRADGGVPIVIVVVILLFFRCCFHRCSHRCQYHLVIIMVIVGDPTAGEHREGEQERHHRAVCPDQEIRGGGQD